MPPTQQLPRYKSHKEVWALKIKKLEESLPSGDCMFHPEDGSFEPIFLPKEYMEKHKPEVGGYYVVYKDGYKSFSPAEAFEEGYTKV